MKNNYPLAEQAYAILMKNIPAPALYRLGESSLFRGDDLVCLNTVVFLELVYLEGENDMPSPPLNILEKVHNAFPDAEIKFKKEIDLETEYTITVTIFHRRENA